MSDDASRYEDDEQREAQGQEPQPGRGTPDPNEPDVVGDAGSGAEEVVGAEGAAEQPAAEAGTDEATAQLERERDKLFERLQRVSADYQNYMRRSEQELTRAVERSRADLLKQFIPVLDHFDKALATEPGGDEGQHLYQGVRMVRDELLKVLQNAGVERLDVEIGEAFDPHRHEALMQQPAEGVEPGCVAATMQPGYVYGDLMLRPAKVAVTPNA